MFVFPQLIASAIPVGSSVVVELVQKATIPVEDDGTLCADYSATLQVPTHAVHREAVTTESSRFVRFQAASNKGMGAAVGTYNQTGAACKSITAA